MRIDKEKYLILLAEKQLNSAEVAKMIEITPQRLSAILNQISVSPKVCGKVASALGVKVQDIINV